MLSFIELPSIERARKGALSDEEFAELFCARHALGYSQSEFASMLGVSKRTLENWEQGRSEPSGAAHALITVARIKPKAGREALAA
jgi:putative transcriptional regulator